MLAGMNRLLLPLALCLGSCSAAEEAGPMPGDAADTRPFAEIAPDAVIRFAGTEPFWGGSVSGGQLLWSTPEDIAGQTIPVERFAGRGGLSFSGVLAGRDLLLAVTPGTCSDGMSDRTYPYTATVTLGSETLAGCAWLEGDDLGAEA